MVEQNITDLITEIAEKTGKTEAEIKGLIDAKVQKFSGLLTEQGATFMVQKELGLRQEVAIEMKISELSEGMKGVELRGNVSSVFPAKEFEKNGKKGKLKSFILSDGTGEVRVTLWNDQVDKYEATGGITNGSEVEIINAVVSAYNEKKQITLGFNGTINVLNKKEEEFVKLSDIKAGMNSVSVIGRIIRKFPCKEFETAERKGKLCSFQLGDESAVIRVTAWNEKANETEKFNEGDPIEILNAYTKEGRFGAEMNLGYRAEIRESTKQLPSTMEILKESTQEKKINSLVDGENVIIVGKVTEVLQGNLAYLVCEKCGKKATAGEKGILCENCGEVKGKKSAVISATLEDDTGKVKATFFRGNALGFMKLSEEELEKELGEKSAEKIIEELNGTLKGGEIKVYGYQKTSSFSGENEFMAKEIL